MVKKERKKESIFRNKCRTNVDSNTHRNIMAEHYDMSKKEHLATVNREQEHTLEIIRIDFDYDEL